MIIASRKEESEVVKDDNSYLLEYCNFLRKKYIPKRRVLLVQIPQVTLKSFNREIAKERGYYAFPPTGLQYLYDSFKTRDLEFKILDVNFELLRRVAEDESFDHNQWLTIFEEHFRAYNPFIVGISCMFDAGIRPLIELLEYLRNEDRSIIIAGGVIATYEWQKLLEKELCHFIVRGEGENKLNYLFDCLTKESKGFDATGGIHFKFKEEPQESCGEPDVVSVKGDLVESYSLIEVEEYYRYGSLNPFSRMAGIDKSPFAAVQLSRGCRAACSFCAVRDFMGKGVRSRSIDEVISEMDYLINKKGVRHFEWLDDDLLFNRRRFQQLLETIISRGWSITWSANNGLIATSIDSKTLELMKASGCIGFKVGIETGNEDMLRRVGKPATLGTFRKLSLLLKDFPEIFVGGNFIIGLPEETFGQMMDSFRFYLELDLDWAAFTICQVIRGASAFSDFDDYFEEQMNSEGDLIKNFIPSRESSTGQVSVHNRVTKGQDIFNIDSGSVPSEDQVKEIWFTFNLVGNYMYNKNLTPGGRVEKFISWVEMAQMAYPTNPYMSLFLSLAYIIKGNSERSREYYDKTMLYNKNDYWRERFADFGLNEVVRNFPKTKHDVFDTIENLRRLSSFQLYDSTGDLNQNNKD